VPDDPIALLFGGMGKLGPGSDEATAHVLRLLPDRPFELIVDAGCGAGRQTLALASTLHTAVHGVDSHQPFLDELQRRARDAGVEQLMHTHCLDMADIASHFSDIDLLWSEGAAYNIGFANALTVWAPAIAADGYAVVSELCWLRSEVDDDARRFLEAAYPDMQSVDAVREAATRAGYEVLAMYTLPRRAWFDDYYDVLGPRATELRSHPDQAVRQFAEQTLAEIDIFRRCDGDYGYVFFAMCRV
jgi:cyclopropane fatty-acyl-phospholipid synthase-like methyltransferase